MFETGLLFTRNVFSSFVLDGLVCETGELWAFEPLVPIFPGVQGSYGSPLLPL